MGDGRTISYTDAMSLDVWIVFAVTEAALCLTPGPAVLLVLSQALTRGTRASLWSNAGTLRVLRPLGHAVRARGC
jgi:homoserine/homoserine lactone efflux protein